MGRTIIAEVCRTIRAALPSWGHALRLCLIILVLTAAVAVVAHTTPWL